MLVLSYLSANCKSGAERMGPSVLRAASPNTPVTPSRHLAAWMRVTHAALLLFAVGATVLGVPVGAQSTEAANKNTGSVLGRVVDTADDPVPNATVVLQGPSSDRLTELTKDDGSFAFNDVRSGTAYQITVTAEGFQEWNSSIAVEPGQDTNLNNIKLRVVAVERSVTVRYSAKEVAVQQLKAEEQQRVLGFIPNIYVVYDPHPEPLTTGMKFHLAYKNLTHPTFFVFEALWAGALQAANSPDYQQGAKGYGERFGANLAGGTTQILVGNALLPSILHQDPRYFYQGTGTRRSRARHAILSSFICNGDNGKLQPNYSQWGGTLAAAALANAYYPASNRGAGLVFRNFGTNMGLNVVLNLAQEFVLNKLTSKGKR